MATDFFDAAHFSTRKISLSSDAYHYNGLVSVTDVSDALQACETELQSEPMAAKIEAFYDEVGRRIRIERTKLGLTQEDLGKLLTPPTTRVSVANVESGRQRILAHTLVQFARALKLETTSLFPDSDEVSKPYDANPDIATELVEKAGLSAARARKLVKDPTKLKLWKEEDERQ